MNASVEMMAAALLPVSEEPQNAEREKPINGPPDEDTVQAEFEARLKAAQRHSADWREEALDLYDMECGKQWNIDDENRMKEQSRPMVTFNVMQKFIDAVCGLQINNRQDIKCYPRVLGKARVSDLATSAISWTRTCAHVDRKSVV